MKLYNKFLKKIAHFQVEHPFITLLFILLLTFTVYGGIEKVNTVASLEQMMPSDIEEIKAFNELRDNNMGQDMIAIILELNRNSYDEYGINDMRDYEVYKYSKHVKQLLEKELDVLQIYAYSDVVDSIYNNMMSKDNEAFIPITSKDLMSKEAFDNIINNPQTKEYISDFINHDASVSVIIISTDVSADDPRMNLLSSKIKESLNAIGHPPGIEIKFTGSPIIQQKLGVLIGEDRENTKLISTLLVFIIVMITFGTFTSAIVPIVVVTLSVNWLYSIMGHTGLPISTLAGGVAAMVIGIGIDFAIHIINKFKYERKKGLSIKQSVEEAVVDTGTALTATSFTTIGAFLAFFVGQMPEMGRFGLLMAIGITFSLIFSLFGLPALLVLEEKLIYRLKKKAKFGIEGELHLEGKEKNKKQINKNKKQSNSIFKKLSMEYIGEKIAIAQTNNPKAFLIVFGILALLFLPGIFNLVNNVEPSLEKILPQDIEEVQNMNNMRGQFGADMIYLLVYTDNIITDTRDPLFLNYVNTLSQKIETEEHIESVNTLSDLVLESNNNIPDSKKEIIEILKENQLTKQYTNYDYSFAVISIKSDTGASAKIIDKVITNIEDDLDSLNYMYSKDNVKITGFNAIDKATFEVIISDFAFIMLISMLVVSIIVLITFKSLSKGMLPMIVVMNALLWTMGIVGYLGLTITVVSMVSAAMILGLGIDFGIHVVYGYYEKRNRHNPKESVREIMKELLRAMTGASLTTIAGFLALLFGVLPAMKNLGIILAIGIFTTLIAAIFLLPVVVYLYDINQTKKLKLKSQTK